MPTLTRQRQITRKEVRGLFAKAFITQARDVIWPEICETIDTFTENEYFATLGSLPQVVEITPEDEVDFSELNEYTYDFRNRLYKSLVRLKRSLVDFDQTGQSRTLVHSLAGRVVNFPDKLMINQMRNGTSATLGLCLTGSAFFASTHNLGGKAPVAQSNLLTGNTPTSMFTGVGTLRPVIAQNLQTDLDLAIVQMLAWQDDNGEPFYQKLNPADLVIVCSPLMFTSFKLALGAKFIAQTDNVFEGYIGGILSSNYLPISGAEAADWYLINKGYVNRPFLYSRFRQRTDAEMQDVLGQGMEKAGSPFNITMEDLRNLSSVEILTNLESRGGTNADSHVILHEEFLLAARWRGFIAYGVPWTCMKVNNSA